ncbi:MAG: hypothetical protein ACM3YM_01505 [Sphingomonadales bacterium]
MALHSIPPRILSALLFAALLCVLPLHTAAAAQADLLSPETLSAVGDFRLVATNGERSWTKGGFGKARFGGADDRDFKVRPVAGEAALIWQPRLTWSLSGTVVAAVQQGQEHPVDLVEAYLTLKPLPHGSTRLSGRAGLFWPQISLEHQGPAWSVADMITPSAINSWIGEEVKVVGAEASIAEDLGGNQLSGTVGVFGFNDTAGTMLAFRGWALHDLKATAFGHQRLPPLGEDLEYYQAARTRPLIEIDDRPGFYGRLAWRMAAPVTLSAFYYRNRARPEAKTRALQWGWNTVFWNLGARVDLSSNTKILVQALTGWTEMGFERDDHYWVETRFRSAYLRLSHQIGAVTLSGRTDWFGTRERGSRMERDESERGWAGTAAASWKLSSHVNLLGEVLHIASKRGNRDRLALAPHQAQTVVQASLRLTL